MKEIREIYITFKDRENRKKLSEKLIRKRLEKEGWIVWRGENIGLLRRHDEVYPNVRKKYGLLIELIEKHHPNVLEQLQYISHVHHGMPDFLAYKEGKFKFVECKLGYETLKDNQKKTIALLVGYGFIVEIHRMAELSQKTRIAHLDPLTFKKKIVEKQKKLSLNQKISTTRPYQSVPS